MESQDGSPLCYFKENAILLHFMLKTYVQITNNNTLDIKILIIVILKKHYVILSPRLED
jgi:hypothetical protein